MAPKTAMKAMKTATKGPKSVKPTRATAAKGKSKNAKDKSNKSVTDELKVYNFKNSVKQLNEVSNSTKRRKI